MTKIEMVTDALTKAESEGMTKEQIMQCADLKKPAQVYAMMFSVRKKHTVKIINDKYIIKPKVLNIGNEQPKQTKALEPINEPWIKTILDNAINLSNPKIATLYIDTAIDSQRQHMIASTMIHCDNARSMIFKHLSL